MPQQDMYAWLVYRFILQNYSFCSSPQSIFGTILTLFFIRFSVWSFFALRYRKIRDF